MPKQLINIIGLVVCLGILALAIALVAVPMYLQSVGTNAEASQVAQTNDIYQIQVDSLEVQSERMDEIEASVADHRAEIPATNRLDDVFELIARSASATGVELQTATAGLDAPFTVRTEALVVGEVAEVTEPAETDPTTDPAVEDPAAAAPTDTSGDVPVAAGDGRVQVDFVFTVTAVDFNTVVRFLDALRSGPRLLSSIQSTVIPTGTGYDVTVSALTFVLPEA
ncbi:hypothetical protein ASD56_07975 [Microbacterium sp. Root166]|uniref:hypothetical protein n=1 Tax=Microbacterium sp. Root166 TaxID=1736478 RepID=UPI0006F2451A|nr:hypothetical protein [Microbacterium sp. Root166]KQZ83961.1 hypothetical protein ASD56_07975 [Microbacterium sp. Root166]